MVLSCSPASRWHLGRVQAKGNCSSLFPLFPATAYPSLQHPPTHTHTHTQAQRTSFYSAFQAGILGLQGTGPRAAGLTAKLFDPWNPGNTRPGLEGIKS